MEFTSTQTVTLIDRLGSDASVVNAARVSFGGAGNAALSEKDVKLIEYLAKHKHYSPFRHAMLQFRIRMPEFCARQFYKHVVGIECTSTHPTKDHAWNEISGRYKAYDAIYVPREWKKQHSNAKQCSGNLFDAPTQKDIGEKYEAAVRASMEAYNCLLERGVSREQARMLLPLTIMTEVVWTASLQAVHNFVVLRNAPDAQDEIRELAGLIDAAAKDAFPVSYAALVKHHHAW